VSLQDKDTLDPLELAQIQVPQDQVVLEGFQVNSQDRETLDLQVQLDPKQTVVQLDRQVSRGLPDQQDQRETGVTREDLPAYRVPRVRQVHRHQQEQRDRLGPMGRQVHVVLVEQPVSKVI
jgi:phage-related minor tail protein